MIYLTTNEVCELLSIKPTTLRQWRRLKMGPPFIKLTDRSIRYAKEDLQQWLKKQTVLFTPTEIIIHPNKEIHHG